jgi:hypothetical protein
MSLSITTLNNEAAAAKTFTLIGRDKVSSEWLNTSDSDDDFTSTLVIKQQQIGKNAFGVPILRTLAQLKVAAIDTSGTANRDTNVDEFTVNMTVTGPKLLTSLTDTNRKDAVAFIRNLMSASVLTQLLRGEV